MARTQQSGINGTCLQEVRAFRLRQASYRGRAKGHLQDIVTAAAIDDVRLDQGLCGVALVESWPPPRLVGDQVISRCAFANSIDFVCHQLHVQPWHNVSSYARKIPGFSYPAT